MQGYLGLLPTRLLLAICMVFMPLVMGGGGDSVSQDSMFWPTSGIGDGVATGYASDQWGQFLRMTWLKSPSTQYVALDYLDSLEVTNPAGVTLRVASGGAIVYGFPYRNSVDVDFALAIPVINTTGWRLVLRADWVTQTVRLVLLESADGVLATPAMTQTAGVRYEVTLATGTITIAPAVAITDERTYLEPSIEIDNEHITNRTRRFFVNTAVGFNNTDGTEIFRFSSSGLICPDLKQCTIQGWFTAPIDFRTGGTMTVTAVVTPDAGGNVWSTPVATYGGCGENFSAHIVTPGASAKAVINGFNNCVDPLVLTGVEVGDLIRISWSRDGVAAGDTVGAAVNFTGWFIDYAADM